MRKNRANSGRERACAFSERKRERERGRENYVQHYALAMAVRNRDDVKCLNECVCVICLRESKKKHMWSEKESYNVSAALSCFVSVDVMAGFVW